MSTLSSGSKSEVIDCMEISAIVSGHDGGEHIKLSDVFTVAEIPLKATSSPSLEEMTRLHHLQGITLSEIPDKKVGLLIGLDASLVFRAMDTWRREIRNGITSLTG